MIMYLSIFVAVFLSAIGSGSADETFPTSVPFLHMARPTSPEPPTQEPTLEPTSGEHVIFMNEIYAKGSADYIELVLNKHANDAAADYKLDIYHKNYAAEVRDTLYVDECVEEPLEEESSSRDNPSPDGWVFRTCYMFRLDMGDFENYRLGGNNAAVALVKISSTEVLQGLAYGNGSEDCIKLEAAVSEVNYNFHCLGEGTGDTEMSWSLVDTGCEMNNDASFWFVEEDTPGMPNIGQDLTCLQY